MVSILKETSRNLDTISFSTPPHVLLYIYLLTYISETVSEIFFIISSPKLSSIASGFVSSLSFARRNMIISLLGVIALVVALP